MKLLDLSEKRCPTTFVYTKLALERLQPGEKLEVRFSNAESAENVALSVREEGYAVCQEAALVGESSWSVVIEKPALQS